MQHTSFKLEDEMVDRIKNLLPGTQTISQFSSIATIEKVKRMEVRNKQTRTELFKKDIEAFTPIVIAIIKSAKSNNLLE